MDLTELVRTETPNLDKVALAFKKFSWSLAKGDCFVNFVGTNNKLSITVVITKYADSNYYNLTILQGFNILLAESGILFVENVIAQLNRELKYVKPVEENKDKKRRMATNYN